jgi:beta-glucanase (GH16 family)
VGALPNDEFTLEKQPAYLILNVAVGGNLGGSVSVSDISNMTMRVDYVRVWKP